MTNAKETAIPYISQKYDPVAVTATRGYSYDYVVNAPITASRDQLIRVDALFHYFVDEYDSDTIEGEADVSITQAEVIGKLVTRKYSESDYITNPVYRHEPPTWTRFRDNANFISGELITDVSPVALRNWIKYYHGDDVVILDASDYLDKPDDSELLQPFDQFMKLANTQQKVIEEGLCQLYPSDTRAAIQFLNAYQSDEIGGSPNADTKWLAEGRILASELLTVPGFQKNFNLLVITNAAKFIHTDRLNLNNIYRLLAKLGRVNTRIVFLG